MTNRDDQPADDTMRWLLDGDPAIRWQILQDLIGAAEKTVERERAKVARDGWGASLLSRQDPEGTWAGRLYSPKWTSTTYTMLLLRDSGLPTTNRKARKACGLLLNGGLQPDGGINYGGTGTSETCITGMVLSILCYFNYADDRLDTLVEHLLAQQMLDGGWNCRRLRGATHSSVHTTISVLEGLRFYMIHCGRKRRLLETAQCRGHEFLLMHRLFRSDRTGEVIKPIFLRFTFPPRWHYDILRALDYFRAVDAPRDHRLGEAIDIVRSTQCQDGRWTLRNRYQGKTYFEMERVGAPSRWNTLRALRVLKWWQGPTSTPSKPSSSEITKAGPG